jgi:hypothetical protein
MNSVANTNNKELNDVQKVQVEIRFERQPSTDT